MTTTRKPVRPALNEAALEAAVRAYDVARATCLREDGESLMNAIERRGRVAMSVAITAYLEALPVPIDEATFDEFMGALKERDQALIDYCVSPLRGAKSDALVDRVDATRDRLVALFLQAKGEA